MKMQRFFIIGLAVLLVVLAAFRPHSHTVMTIKVVERAETDAVTDTGQEGDTVGDILTFANKVFDEKNEKQIGTDNGYCFRTAVGSAWECAWTLTLDDGSLTVQGPFYDKGDSMLAITGGTGEYAEARGSMKLHARNDAGSEYDFVYDIAE
jgi:hypothetical protein